MKRIGMILFFAAIAAGGYGAWWWWHQGGGSAADGKGGKGKGKGAALTVKATKAVAKAMPVLIEAVGTVEPEHSVQIRAQVSGVLQSVLFKEGDLVKAGQQLFQIGFQRHHRQFVVHAGNVLHDLPAQGDAHQSLQDLWVLSAAGVFRQSFDDCAHILDGYSFLE